jgi:hypothetical protein
MVRKQKVLKDTGHGIHPTRRRDEDQKARSGDWMRISLSDLPQQIALLL